MVSHVLVDHSSGNINCFIIGYLEQNFAEAFQSLLELVCLMVHEPQMETGRHEVFLQLECLVIHIDCLLVELGVLDACLLELQLCLSLECKTFRVPQLCIVRCNADSSIVVVMCKFKQLLWLPIEEHVTSIEVNRWIIWVFLDSQVEVCLRLLQPVDVVVSETSVVIVHRRLFYLNCFTVMYQGFFKLSLFEVRKTQVVMDASSVIFHLSGFFEIFNRFVEVLWSKPSETDTFVEASLVLVILFSNVLKRLGVIINCLFYLVQS